MTSRTIRRLLGCIGLVAALSSFSRPMGPTARDDLLSGISTTADVGAGPLATYPLVEPHLSIDQHEPLHLIVAAMAPQSADNRRIDCAVFASVDGGKSWSSALLRLGSCADTWTAILDDGTPVIAYLSRSAIVGGQGKPAPLAPSTRYNTCPTTPACLQ